MTNWEADRPEAYMWWSRKAAVTVLIVGVLAGGCSSGAPGDEASPAAAEQSPSSTPQATTSTTTSTTTTTGPPPTTAAPTTAAPAAPPCTKAALEKAWNAKHDQKGYKYTVDAAPKCDADVAAVAVTSTTPDDMGNPDFGTATFVASNGAWKPLARYRAMDQASILKDSALSSLSASQKRRLAAIAADF